MKIWDTILYEARPFLLVKRKETKFMTGQPGRRSMGLHGGQHFSTVVAWGSLAKQWMLLLLRCFLHCKTFCVCSIPLLRSQMFAKGMAVIAPVRILSSWQSIWIAYESPPLLRGYLVVGSRCWTWNKLVSSMAVLPQEGLLWVSDVDFCKLQLAKLSRKC